MLGRLFLVCITVFLGHVSYAQETNKLVSANIDSKEREGGITVDILAQNKTELLKNVRYVLFTYKEDIDENVISSEDTERLVLQAYQKKKLTSLDFGSRDSHKITIVLLIYDDSDRLIGRDRKVVINHGEPEAKTKIFRAKASEDTYFNSALRGIVTEQTKTKPGRDFYLEFSSSYRLNQINGPQVVTIFERFSFGRNTILEIKVGNKVVHRFFTQPRRDFLMEQAQMAIIKVSKYFKMLEDNKNRFKLY